MKITQKLLLIALLIAFLSSCKIMYVPNNQNIPMLEEKGDIKANLGFKDLQLAYGITDHIGIMANGYYNKNEWTANTEISNNKYLYEYLSTRSLIEGGLGYYSALGGAGRFEVYGGAGYGKVNFDYDLLENGTQTETNTFKVDMMRIFIQPAIGMQSDNFGFAFSTRLASLTFSNINYTGYTQAELEDEGLHELEDDMFMFIEPAITLRAGFRYIQLQFQPYYNMRLSGPSSINSKTYGLNFGVYLSIDDFFKIP